METTFPWDDLPLKVQVEVLLHTEIYALMRCRYTCKAMARIILDKDFQKEYTERHGQSCNIFFSDYLTGGTNIAINIYKQPMWTKLLVQESSHPTGKKVCRFFTIPSVQPLQPGAPVVENILEPRDVALPVFGAPVPLRLAPATAMSSTSRVRPNRKSQSKSKGENQNHLMQSWTAPDYHTHREMYNCLYQGIFRSKAPIEVINLSGSDEE